jgi:uncharacterized repeat protein (TIGR01451 family)/uncharacterized protein (TIGR03382 family)
MNEKTQFQTNSFWLGLTLFGLVLWSPTVLAQLVFSKSFSPETIGPGSVSTLVLSIDNIGQTPVENISFSDELPAGLQIAVAANSVTDCTNAILEALPDTTSISFSNARLGIGQSCSISVDVVGSVPGEYLNVTSELTSSEGNTPPAMATLTLDAGRPGLLKSFSPDQVSVGATTVLTLTIDNSLNPAVADFLSLSDVLPEGMQIADPANIQTDCGPDPLYGDPIIQANPGERTIAMFNGYVEPNSTCSLSLDVVVLSAGIQVNTTSQLIMTMDNLVCGKASAVLDASADQINLNKVFVTNPVMPAGVATIEFTITNFNRDSAASSISFSDDLNNMLSGAQAIGLPLADPCGSGSELSGTNVIVFENGYLEPQTSCSFTVDVQLPGDAAFGSYINTTSTITAEVDGRSLEGGPGIDLLNVSAAPRLSMSFAVNPVGAGSETVLEFTIENTSTVYPATQVSFVDNISAFMPGIQMLDAATDVCGSGSSLGFYSIDIDSYALILESGALDPAATCTFAVSLPIPVGTANGVYVNTVSDISALIEDVEQNAASVSQTLEVVAGPRLRMSFLDDLVLAGDTITLEFELIHDENAPDQANNITFSDNLATVLGGLSALDLPANDICGTGSVLEDAGANNIHFSGGSLEPGSSCSFNVDLLVPPEALSGIYMNTTSQVTASVLGIEVIDFAAEDSFQVGGLLATKEFIDDPTFPGDTVTMDFTLENLDSSLTIGDIIFTDDLNQFMAGIIAINPTQDDICGIGSSLFANNNLLIFTGGSLAPQEICSFSVELQIPAESAAGQYNNVTSMISASLGAQPIVFDPASDSLLVADPLLISKSFSKEIVAAGDAVELEFVLANADAGDTALDLAFSDDLEQVLPGLVAVGLPLDNICGDGSTITGTNLLEFSGGSLAPSSECTFSVTLQIPQDVQSTSVITNVTSRLQGSLNQIPVFAEPAQASLKIQTVNFTKSFEAPAMAGGQVVLSFVIENLDPHQAISGLAFTDDLENMLSGLVAVSLPDGDFCGDGSNAGGTSQIQVRDITIGPGASCSFDVTLQVPQEAEIGTYENVSSDLYLDGNYMAGPARAILTVLPSDDEEGVEQPDGGSDGGVDGGLDPDDTITDNGTITDDYTPGTNGCDCSTNNPTGSLSLGLILVLSILFVRRRCY